MLSDSARLDKMSSGAANVGHRTAATEIARIVLDIAAKENKPSRKTQGKPMTALPAHLERVHMVGIGGAGMSRHRSNSAFPRGLVSGSDAKESRGVLALRARGAQVRIGHDADALDLLPGGPTVVVTTHAAIPKDNPELVEAARRGIPVILRPAVLASLMQGNRTFLVSGTHGKTSTTSMLVVALPALWFRPFVRRWRRTQRSGNELPITAAVTSLSRRRTRVTGRCCSTTPT